MIINYNYPSRGIHYFIKDMIDSFDNNSDCPFEIYDIISSFFDNIMENDYFIYKTILSLCVANFYSKFEELNVEESEDALWVLKELIECSDTIDDLMPIIEDNIEIRDILTDSFIYINDLSLQEDIYYYLQNKNINKNYNPFFKVDMAIISLENKKPIDVVVGESLIGEYLYIYSSYGDREDTITEMMYELQVTKRRNTDLYLAKIKVIIKNYYFYKSGMLIINPDTLDDLDYKIISVIESNSDNIGVIIEYINKNEAIFRVLLEGYFQYSGDLDLNGIIHVEKANKNNQMLKTLYL